jgi:3-methylcrotonyl-CoA carboxylase alpha subunit
VRVDTGVEQGDLITPHYDPMIAKLIVWGADRRQALARMQQALGQYRVVGVNNNVEFLSRLVGIPSFANADLDTGLIEREQAALFPETNNVPDDVWLLAALAELEREAASAKAQATYAADRDSPWRILDGWRLNGRAERTLVFQHDDVQATITIQGEAGGSHSLSLNGHRVHARASIGADCEIRAQLGDRSARGAVVPLGERRHVFLGGRSWILSLVDPLQASEADEVEGSLRAPMPGKVIALSAAVGAKVEKGSPLLVMEAMKMEHTIAAPCRGVVKGFFFAEGDQVTDGAQLVEFEAETT